MEIDRKKIVEQEQMDIDDEMAEDEEGDLDDNSWLGRLGDLLSPCRPIYHSTGQPLYPDISAETVKAEIISRLAHELKAQKEAFLQQTRGLNTLSSVVNSSSNPSIHFENADVTITKIQRNNPLDSRNRYKEGISRGNFHPISVASIKNGNTKHVTVNGTRSYMKYQSSKVPVIKKRTSTINSSPIKHQTASTNSSALTQSSSPVIKKLKEDLKLAKSAIRTCPICSEDFPDLNSHVRIAHGVEGVVCPHCSKILAKTCTLSRHIEQVHLNLQIHKPAQCGECGKVFSKKGHLDRHVKTIHMGMKEESQPCPHCGKIFSTKSSLEPHILMVHKGVRKKCPDCGKVLSDLWKHMRTIHGHYRRRVKIPKEEALLQMTSTGTYVDDIEDDDIKTNTSSSLSSPSSAPTLSTPPPLEKLSNQGTSVMDKLDIVSKNKKENVNTSESLTIKAAQVKVDGTKSNAKESNKKTSSLSTSKNKRKNSLPLKVKMPFKISKKSSESGSQIRKDALRLSDDDVDL